MEYTRSREFMVQVEDQQNTAKVYETRYRPIEGFVKPPSQFEAARTMSVFEIRRGLRGIWPKFPLILAFFIVFGLITQLDTFVLESAKEFWLGGTDASGTPLQNMKTNIFFLLKPIDGPGFIISFSIAVISSGLIAGDLRDRAIDLYYSKISVRSYFVSKVVASMVLAFIGMPFFAVIYFFVGFYKRFGLIDNYGVEFSSMFEVFYGMSLAILVTVSLLAAIILVFSAFTSNPVNAGVGFMVFNLVARVFFEVILYPATNIDFFYTLSPLNSLDVLTRAILSPDDVSKQFLNYAILSYFIYLVLSLSLVWMKLRKEKSA